MASTYSALKIELIGTGEQSGTWGTTTNTNLGDAALGEAITGSADVNFATDADVTITLTDVNTTQAARNLRLNITESSTGIGSVRNLILGSGCQIEKFYLINNTGTGAKTVKNTSGTGIAVPAGKATLVYNNGTNVVDAATYFTSLTLGSALPVASGGTGSTSTTYVNLTTNVTGTLPVTNGGTGVATITGVIKGAGTGAFAAATAGTDFVAPGTATTFTAKQSFNGATATLASSFKNAVEFSTQTASAPTSTIQYDVTTQSVHYYTTSAANNWIVNFRGNATTSLDTLMSTYDALTVVVLATQGATAYYNTAITIDGVSFTPKYQGGTTPTSGNASGVDAYSYTIVKTGSAAFTVFAAQTRFA